MKIAWGIDVGVASLGFAVIALDKNGQPQAIIDGVSHVYDAPTGSADRRLYRSMRTQNQRRARRLRDLGGVLTDLLGIDPAFDTQSPACSEADKPTCSGGLSRVRLRASGIDDALSAEDLARAIMHIARNRGRRLSRGLKDDGDSDLETVEAGERDGQGKKGAQTKSAADAANQTAEHLKALGEALYPGQNRAATPGQLLRRREENGLPTRMSKHTPDAPMITRRMMEDELARLLARQAEDHAALTPEARARVTETVFHEEEPKPPRVGACRYGVRDANGAVERRLPIACDLFQTKRLLEELAHQVTLTDPQTGQKTRLTLEQRDTLLDIALTGEDLSAARVRKALALGTCAEAPILGLEAATARKGKGGKSGKGRKTEGKIAGHAIAKACKEAGQADLWQRADARQRDRLSEALRTEDDFEGLTDTLVAAFDLSVEDARRLARTKVPQGYSAAGPTATRRIVEQMRTAVMPVSEAVERAGLDDGLRVAEHTPRGAPLPYYGEALPDVCVGGSDKASDPPEVRFGTLANPVVHAALNRIRKVANEYLKRYGPPERICLELARDMNKSAEDREKIEFENRSKQKENDRLAKMLIMEGLPATRRYLKMMRLREWQKSRCLYTGDKIEMHHIKGGAVDIDHILPRARTMDDHMGNLALCFRKVNAQKGDRAPHAAFYPRLTLKNGFVREYVDILDQVKADRPGSLWRFEPDALEHFKAQDRFQERFLNDTRYIGKVARAYLARLVPRDSDVLCLTGGITGALRKAWGLSTLIRDIMIEEGRLDPALFVDQETPPADPAAREAHADALAARVRAKGKIRWDDRHHLLDAIVAGCVTRSDVQRLQTLSARGASGDDATAVLAEVRRGLDGHPAGGACWSPQTFPAHVKAFLTDITPERPTRVTIKPDHDPRGQLHQQTQLGVICENPKKAGSFVTITRQEIQGLAGVFKSRADFEKKLSDSLDIGDPARRAVADAHRMGAPLWWGRKTPNDATKDPLPALNNLKQANDALKKALLAAWDQASETPDDKGKPKTATILAREAVSAVIKARKQYRYCRIDHQQVRVWACPKTGRPLRAYVTKGNHGLVCYLTAEGNRDIEIMTTLDANQPDHTPRWKAGGGRLLFILHKGDLIEMDAPPEGPMREQAINGRALYRLAAISGGEVSIDVECYPVPESRTRKQLPPGVCERFGSKEKFLGRRPIPVILTTTGYLKWKPPMGN